MIYFKSSLCFFVIFNSLYCWLAFLENSFSHPNLLCLMNFFSKFSLLGPHPNSLCPLAFFSKASLLGPRYSNLSSVLLKYVVLIFDFIRSVFLIFLSLCDSVDTLSIGYPTKLGIIKLPNVLCC